MCPNESLPCISVFQYVFLYTVEPLQDRNLISTYTKINDTRVISFCSNTKSYKLNSLFFYFIIKVICVFYLYQEVMFSGSLVWLSASLFVVAIALKVIINSSFWYFYVDSAWPNEEGIIFLGKIRVIFWKQKNPEFSKVPTFNILVVLALKKNLKWSWTRVAVRAVSN